MLVMCMLVILQDTMGGDRISTMNHSIRGMITMA